MSGLEIPAIVTLASLAVTTVSTAAQVSIANDAADLKQQQLRQQSVELRIQENQSTVERQKKMAHVLAAEEISAGMRGISAQSGSVRALSMENMSNFLADENASGLNNASKQLALRRQGQLVQLDKNAQVFNSISSGVRDASKTVISYKDIPNRNLVDASRKIDPLNGRMLNGG